MPLGRQRTEVEGNETLIVEDGETLQLARDLDGEGVKERLEREKMRSGVSPPAKIGYDLNHTEFRQKDHLTELQVHQERAQQELLIHAKLDVMQLVRTQFRTPDETDEAVS